MDAQTLMSIMQMILTFGNLCIMAYAFSKFLSKPHDSLEERVDVLELKMKEHEDSLHLGNDRFRDLKQENTLIVKSLIALIEFEADYCYHHGGESISPKLEKAKSDLYEFLAEK